MARKKRSVPEVNAGSMADIAFLLLIFWLVTTTIITDKGLPLILPPFTPPEDQEEIDIPDRRLFNVLINFKDQLLVEGEGADIRELRKNAKEFILNENNDDDKPESPELAILSLKTDRGTKYSIYIRVLDELRGAYHELRAEHMEITVEEYLAFEQDKASEEMVAKFEEAKDIYPMNISEAEPTNIGGQ